MASRTGRSRLALLLLLLVVLTFSARIAAAYSDHGREEREEREERREREKERERERERERREPEYEPEHGHEHETEPGSNETSSYPFILDNPKEFARTQAGVLRVLPRRVDKEVATLKDVGLAFLTLEPKGLLLPHYLDASVVLYIQKGSARVGWVEDYEYVHRDLEAGDVYTLEGGTVHYILNTDKGLRLQIFSLIDARHSLVRGHFQPFFVAGGWDPVTILSGFDAEVVAAAFNLSRIEVGDLLNAQSAGPMVYTTAREAKRITSGKRPSFLPYQPSSLNSRSWWDWFQQSVGQIPLLGWTRSDEAFNLLKKKPDFKNKNGWSSTVDKTEFSRLKKPDVGLFAVSLKAGSMLAPHWNPRATEIALVTRGYGYVHIAYPNGTKALHERVEEGTVFVVPRYHPVSQVASRDGTFEFVGFSTSSRPNKPQFLAGRNSVLAILEKETDHDILPIAFDIEKARLQDFLGAQDEDVILSGFVEETRANHRVSTE